MVTARARRYRIAPLIILIGATMVMALWAGLVRIGWSLGGAASIVNAHGPLMVVGVVATVVSIERAVALDRSWAFAAPFLSLVAALGVAFGAPVIVCAAVATVGACVLVATLVMLSRRANDLPSIAITLAGVIYLVGCAKWVLGAPVFVVLPFWTVWLVLTISSERLELTRVMRPSPFARATFIVLAIMLCVSLALPAWIRGSTTVAVALWLLRFDVARRSIKKAGLPRFTAFTLLGGYVWLALSGAALIAFGNQVAGPFYDAITHAVMLGFVFAMIFGHAPIILPAIAGVALPFQRVFYAHVVLLHVGLVVRIAGDLLGHSALRAWGGLLNVTALVLFMCVSAARVARSKQRTS